MDKDTCHPRQVTHICNIDDVQARTLAFTHPESAQMPGPKHTKKHERTLPVRTQPRLRGAVLGSIERRSPVDTALAASACEDGHQMHAYARSPADRAHCVLTFKHTLYSLAHARSSRVRAATSSKGHRRDLPPSRESQIQTAAAAAPEPVRRSLPRRHSCHSFGTACLRAKRICCCSPPFFPQVRVLRLSRSKPYAGSMSSGVSGPAS
jgi:hypothetical protein